MAPTPADREALRLDFEKVSAGILSILTGPGLTAMPGAKPPDLAAGSTLHLPIFLANPGEVPVLLFTKRILKV